MGSELKIPPPVDADVRFVLQAIVDELRYCHEDPADRQIGYTEAAWMLDEYLTGNLDPGDFDSSDVFDRIYQHYGWNHPHGK